MRVHETAAAEPGTNEPSALKGAETPSPGGCRLLCLQNRTERMQIHRPDHLCRKLESSHAMEGDTEALRGSAACASSHSVLAREPGRCSGPAAQSPPLSTPVPSTPQLFCRPSIVTGLSQWCILLGTWPWVLSVGLHWLRYPQDICSQKQPFPLGRGANVDHFLCPNSNNNNSTIVIIMLAGNY